VAFSLRKYMKLTAAADQDRMVPVWMSLLLLLRWRGLGVRLTCVTTELPGFPSFVVWPLLHMEARTHDDATVDYDTSGPSPPVICLPTHDTWDNGYVSYRFGDVPGLPFHLLGARTELFLSAVAVILVRCRWPPLDRDVRIDEVRSDADRTTFRVYTLPPVPAPESREAEKVTTVSVRLEDDVHGLTIDHRRGCHAPLMICGGLDGLIVRYACPGCARTNDAHGAVTAATCWACGFFLPDAMIGGDPIRFTFRLRPHLR
jgi:hypothetical protein